MSKDKYSTKMIYGSDNEGKYHNFPSPIPLALSSSQGMQFLYRLDDI